MGNTFDIPKQIFPISKEVIYDNLKLIIYFPFPIMILKFDMFLGILPGENDWKFSSSTKG